MTVLKPSCTTEKVKGIPRCTLICPGWGLKVCCARMTFPYKSNESSCTIFELGQMTFPAAAVAVGIGVGRVGPVGFSPPPAPAGALSGWADNAQLDSRTARQVWPPG